MRWKNRRSFDPFAHGRQNVVRRLLLSPRVRLQAVVVVGARVARTVGLLKSKMAFAICRQCSSIDGIMNKMNLEAKGVACQGLEDVFVASLHIDHVPCAWRKVAVQVRRRSPETVH